MTQPEVEREGRLTGPPHVPTNDGGPACRQARGTDLGTHRANRRKADLAASRGLMGNKSKTNMWTGRTRSSRKRVPGGDLEPVTGPAEVAPNALKPSSTRRKRKRKAHLPLLSRESRDAVADHDVKKLEGDTEEHLNACNVARQASTSATHKLRANAGFAAVRNLYDQQDKVMKILAHRVVDGGLQRARAQKSFAHEKGGQVQYLVEWADSVVLKEHLQILEDNGYSASSTREFSQLGFGPARFLVEASWQPTWEPEARLCEHTPHQEMVDKYRRNNLECSPTRLQAQNIDKDQCTRLQQGLDAITRPCNAYHEALKTHLHISLDLINPDFDIVATGSATIQCENISDCYAKEPPTERPQTLRALAFDHDGKFVCSLGVACMAQLRSRHVGLNGSTLPEDTVALLKRYKHGNESDK